MSNKMFAYHALRRSVDIVETFVLVEQMRRFAVVIVIADEIGARFKISITILYGIN